MKLTRIFLSLLFVLFASTALAAKPEKSLVCHVGSDRGSADQSYLDNIDCTPTEGWDVEVSGEFRCPDAGKVDLISVSKKANHIGNNAHSFQEEGLDGFLWEDFAPEDGVGDDPADFEEGDVVGIDQGCELAEENLTCPCWDTFTESELVAVLNSLSFIFPSCHSGADYATSLATTENAFISVHNTLSASVDSPTEGQCRFTSNQRPSLATGVLSVSFDVASACVVELTDIIPQIEWCP